MTTTEDLQRIHAKVIRAARINIAAIVALNITGILLAILT